MLFDIGWSELLLIGVVALVVIGPKDLPRALRVAGFWVRKARTLSREFQSSVEQMIREAELDEIRQELKKASELDIEKEFQKTVDPDGSLAESIKPPEIPDYFEPAPAQSQVSEPAAALAGPTEAPLPAEPVSAEAAPEAQPQPEPATAAEPAAEPAPPARRPDPAKP